ncbi:MAG: response regulator [Leptolyngbyaceae cyanobacterium MO_188.B28]|nr:response regulator [Leptolyngbyaceae cyanobacterium MO_188.B28]
MRILLIEDDEVLSHILVQSLTSQHYAVDPVDDGQMGWEYAQEGAYDLIILDVGLPGIDGISLCQRLRGNGYATPILLMTAKDAPEERIRGLDAGADDYLTKPLDVGELQARVRALLRRGEVAQSPVLEMGSLRLDPSSCQVSYADKPLKLTPKEYSLMELFLRNPSRVFSRGQIVEHLWTFDDPPLEDSVKAHVKGLRRKLKAAGAIDWIENVYGLGYRLNPKVGEHPPQEITVVAPPAPAPPAAAPSPNPSESVQPAYNEAIAALWRQYQGLMAERLDALKQAMQAIEADALSEELRQTAGRAAHKLAGVLGMFERPEGTQLARQLETMLVGSDRKQDSQIPALVNQLEALLNLTESASDPSMDDSQVLTAAIAPTLISELLSIADASGLHFESVKTLGEAERWLKTRSPSLFLLDIDTAGPWEKSLGMLRELSARTPPVPTLVLMSEDGLKDRVAIAQAGGQGALVKPVATAQVWDAANQLLQRSRAAAVNVLAVDDDPIILSALRPMLEPWGVRVTGLEDPTHFWPLLNATQPDLLILDVEMPKFSGIELCQAVRLDPTWQELPILFLTAHRDAETIHQVFTAGADDYVTKPIVGPELLTRITNRLERSRLLQTLSSRDPQTGLSNYTHSRRELDYWLQAVPGNPAAGCLTLLTMPELRQINRRYGHTVGSQVLQQWGDTLKAACRGDELLGYWGDGEFVIGLPNIDKVDVRDRLSSLLTTLRKQVFTAPEGTRFQVSLALGIAECPTDGTTATALYQVASESDDGG